MTQHIVTKGIVLSRTDYQEADRILTVITPDNGKLHIIAKGVRRPKSKLAGGIELFSISDITVLRGRSELKTLVSSRLHKHYGRIVADIQRTMLGYDLLKRVNHSTEDEPDGEYFSVLEAALAGLDDTKLPVDMVDLWFNMALLRVNGNQPELLRDTEDAPLAHDKKYDFDFDTMRFRQHTTGQYTANHIKLLRFANASETPNKLAKLQNSEAYVGVVLALVRNITRQHA